MVQNYAIKESSKNSIESMIQNKTITLLLELNHFLQSLLKDAPKMLK